MSRKEYWMSYSSYKTYRECPKRYRLYKVDKVDPPEKDSKHFAITGSVVQRVYEDFYNLELWRKGSQVSEHLLELTDKYFDEYLSKEYVNFDDVTCRFTMQDVLAECREMVPRILQGIKTHGLLGPYAQSEIALRAHLTKNFFLFGRVDFVIRKADGTVLLLDGKATKKHLAGVDEEQLLYYALAFKIIYGKLPDKVGFFFYKFADDPEKAISWIDITPEKLGKLQTQVLDVFTAIQRKQFKATPSGSACKYCPWEIICEERQAELSKKRAKRRWKDIEAGKDVPASREETGDDSFIGFGGYYEKKD